ncbi:MAG: UDP-glucose 4-epimerase [Hyphomicrobiales bacterium]|nr:MAG: UDP-glucose 4-epimerase [Hyphomicrobiales bacterium]
MEGVVVTGGSGKAGRAVIQDLLDHGYAVLNVDIAAPVKPLCHFIKADLTDMGQTIDVLRHAAGTIDRKRAPVARPDKVIHLAGIPAPGLAPDTVTFANNMISTHNLFSAATLLGLSRVVWASSETVFGLPFTRTPPVFAPATEVQPPAPETSYALAKSLCEEMARQMHRWNPATSFVGLRLSNIFEAADYAQIPSFWDDPALRRWNLWSWVDSRDAAQACRLALQADSPGAEIFTIAAADTLMTRPSRDLMADQFPAVPLMEPLGEFETLLSIDKAGKLLGYTPLHSWRDQIKPADGSWRPGSAAASVEAGGHET